MDVAETNRRLIELRRIYKLSRSELGIYTGYSRSYVDNWLVAEGTQNYREAPANAVRLLEFELGLRKPQLLERAIVKPVAVRKPAKKKARRRG